MSMNTAYKTYIDDAFDAYPFDDEDFANSLEEDDYDWMSDEEREDRLYDWIDELAEEVRGGCADDPSVAFDDSVSRK